MGLKDLSCENLAYLSDEDLLDKASDVVALQRQDAKENALSYYKPANAMVGKIHDLTCGTIGIGGGNGAGKTEHALVEGIIRSTGQIPISLRNTYPRQKLRGPINMRVVCESLTTVLHPVILPKLQWWRWTGQGQPFGSQGHFGWIPKHCLIGGEWKKSWNERLRLLSVLYRDPDDERIIGQSTIQFMSYDQDSTDFASGDVHYCLHDEPPSKEIWNENVARVMRVNGTLVVAMTWPDNPAIAVDWIFDEIYDKANRDPDIAWINIWTTDNPHLDQTSIAKRAGQMDETTRRVRIYGEPIRFSNRIHPLFHDQEMTWCFTCGQRVIQVAGACGTCGGTWIKQISHVTPIEPNPLYPVVHLLDPHPRKPHMMIWVQVDPNDDYHVITNAEVDGSAEDVEKTVDAIERKYGWMSVYRMIDPNMGRSPSGTERGITWQDEFSNVGLVFDLADDSDVGRARLNDYLKPDPQIYRPRITFSPDVSEVHHQLKRYVWAESRRLSGPQKQIPKPAYDDYPTLLKYLMNRMPTYRELRHMGVSSYQPVPLQPNYGGGYRTGLRNG
jgi:phage terminase large subunit-like protein